MPILLVLLLGLGLPPADTSVGPMLWRHQHKFLQVSPQEPNTQPRMRPLREAPIVNVLIQGAWQLDGLNCIGCRLRNAVLRYSGGPFRCSQCWIEESLTVVMSGGAVSTLAVKSWLDKARDGSSDAGVLPLPPVTETVHLDVPLKVDLVSPSVSP